MLQPSQPEVVLPPLRASAGLEVWYRKRLQSLVESMAKSMLLHIRAAYRDADFAVGFATDADPVVRVRSSMSQWGRHWIKSFNDASAEIAGMFARRSRARVDIRMQKILRDAGFTVKFKPSEAVTQAYRATVAENVNLIRSIPQQFLKDVQGDVWRSVMAGGDMGALTKKIQSRYGKTWNRAAFIARDQVHKARAVMEEARRSELGITEAIWVHSGGGRVPRPNHVKWGAERKRYDIKKGMWDSVAQETCWPGTLPNCRCVSRSVIKGLQ